MKQCFIWVLLLLVSCSQTNKDTADESINFLKTFFATYENSGVEKALDDIFLTNKRFSVLPSSDIDNLKKKLKLYSDSIGKYCGYEIILKRTVGTSLIHYSCIVNYEFQPLRYCFTFYKSQGTWVLYNFKFDSEIIDELDESAKFFYIE